MDTRYNDLSTGIMSRDALRTTVHWYRTVNDYMKMFGIVVGGVFASLADWMLGTFTLSILFAGAPLLMPSWVVGLVWSGAAWGVQLILWQLILSGRIAQLMPNKQNRNIAYILLALVIVLAKLGDDGIDMASIFWLSQNNPFTVMLNPVLYKALFYCVAVVSWILVGFSEAFVALSMVLMSNAAASTNRPAPRPTTSYPPISRPTPPVRPFPRTTPATTSTYRNLAVEEPNYHPAGMGSNRTDGD